ncbi:MAG TPA: GTPase, partial [Anaerolineales bacterium]|nr:GTPase [Anaerolineales bacterium]
REELERVLNQLPGGLKGWRELTDHAVRQVRLVSGSKSKVAIVGPANAGKSTLYNLLLRPGEAQAEVSAVPGTTRLVQEGEAGLFSVIDTPGTDATYGVEERERALLAAAQADVLVVLFDAGHGIRGPEREIFDRLVGLRVPMVVGLNKIDLVPRERAEVLGKAAAALGIRSDEIVPVSALHGEGAERLLRAVAESEPEIVAALGQALPAYRWKLSQAVIIRSASAAAAIGLTPLPFVDFIPLVALQISMVLAVGRIYSYRITWARGRELLATVGIGALGRTLFYELSKFGGPPGWVLAAAVAAGTTAALGYALALWFERDEGLTREHLRAMSKAFSQVVVERLRSRGKRRPGRASLRELVQQAMEEFTPVPEPDIEETN